MAEALPAVAVPIVGAPGAVMTGPPPVGTPGVPEPLDALVGVYADPPSAEPLWFREGKRAAVDVNERPAGWGTFDAPAPGAG